MNNNSVYTENFTTANSDRVEYGMMCSMDNPVPHCPVMLVLDTSHSMWGRGLADMMASLDAFYDTLRSEQFSNAQIDIAAVSLGDRLGMLEEFTPFALSGLPQLNIRPKGDTPMGAALSLALEKIAEQLDRYVENGQSHVTPQLIMLSDGESSDDCSVVEEEIRKLVATGRLICRVIATGENPDLAALRAIAGDNVSIARQTGMSGAFANVGKVVSQVYEEEAQEVIIEQATPVERHGGTVYLLDGSNIIHWDEYRTGISLKHLLAITDHLKKERQSFQVFFDATAPHILRKKAPEEAKLYEELLRNDPTHFCQVPAGTRADDFLLLQADANRDALILTQDLFRDHVDQYPWLKTEKRVIPGMVMNNMIFFPDISLQIFMNTAEKETVYDL